MPCAVQIACWLRVLPPETTIPSTPSSTSSQLFFWATLLMKLGWKDGSTLSVEHNSNQRMTPAGASPLAVAR